MHRYGDVDNEVVLGIIQSELRGCDPMLSGRLCGLWMRGSEWGAVWSGGGWSVAGVLMRTCASTAF